VTRVFRSVSVIGHCGSKASKEQDKETERECSGLPIERCST
jgi:hypothetical protein